MEIEIRREPEDLPVPDSDIAAVRRAVERRIGQIIKLAPLVQPRPLFEMRRGDFLYGAVDGGHVGVQPRDIRLPVAPCDPGRAVVIGQISSRNLRQTQNDSHTHRP